MKKIIAVILVLVTAFSMFACAQTPAPAAPLRVFGEACRLGPERLKQANVTFRHIPYDVKAR